MQKKTIGIIYDPSSQNNLILKSSAPDLKEDFAIVLKSCGALAAIIRGKGIETLDGKSVREYMLSYLNNSMNEYEQKLNRPGGSGVEA